MCVVSMVGEHFNDKWKGQSIYAPIIQGLATSVSREEFDALKAEVAELKLLLQRAKKYDEDHNEPDCEIEEKMDILRKIAGFVGINLDDVIGSKSTDGTGV